jgi:16S rRNA (guanine527-N7)-methyltransferase
VEKTLTDALFSGAQAVGVELTPAQLDQLGRFLDQLLVWNKKVNLTAISDPLQAVEGHLVDSLAAVPEVRGVPSILDLGAGGGFPSIPLAVVLPESRFVLADAVGKKVGFLKAAIAGLGLKNAQAVHVRAEGDPQKEKLPVCRLAICRAFMPLPEWLKLAPAYVEEGGSIVAMLGPEATIPSPLPEGLSLVSERSYSLPASKASRRIVVFRKNAAG